MLISSVKKYVWEKGEEWQEKWYVTQLCFQTLTENFNSISKFFAPKGLQVIALNNLWYYETKTSKDWDLGKDTTASNIDILKQLVEKSENYLKKAQALFKETSDLQIIQEQNLNTFQSGFFYLWCIFFCDLGKSISRVLENELKNKGLNIKQIQQVKDYCFNFEHQLGFQQEEKNLQKIKQIYNQRYKEKKIQYQKLSKEIKNLLFEHRKKFQYLTGSELDTEPLSPEDLFNNLNIPVKISTHKGELTKEVKSLLEKEGLDFLSLIKRHIFIDNYAGDLSSKLDFNLNTLISKSYKIYFKELSWYSFDEIENLVKKGKKLSKLQIDQRKKYRMMWQIDGKIEMHYGKQNYIKVKGLIDKKQPRIKLKQFKGMTASLGNVTGTVKVIKEIKDMHKVQVGDILVASNTHPDLMLAIKRCAGIITDYGGITSHAAIVSREFNIPCIVGTNIATRVLKDGDIVNLDANRGLVKILN